MRNDNRTLRATPTRGWHLAPRPRSYTRRPLGRRARWVRNTVLDPQLHWLHRARPYSPARRGVSGADPCLQPGPLRVHQPPAGGPLRVHHRARDRGDCPGVVRDSPGGRWALWTALLSPVIALAVALPLHYLYGIGTLGHLGVIYLDALILLVGIVVAYTSLAQGER